MDLSGRKKDIFDLFQDKQRLTVKELAETLFVSEMTIRRDLKELETAGYLRRFRGGAVYRPQAEVLSIHNRYYVAEDEKKELARRAATYLRDGMTVFLDSSSTCSYIIGHMKKHKGIQIFTNSINALHLASKLQLPCVLTGGEYMPRDMCLVGALAEEFTAKLNVDLAFFTSLGFSDDGVISDVDLPQTAVRKQVLKNAKKSVFLFEKNKLHKKYIYTLCTAEDGVDILKSDE